MIRGGGIHYLNGLKMDSICLGWIKVKLHMRGLFSKFLKDKEQAKHTIDLTTQYDPGL